VIWLSAVSRRSSDGTKQPPLTRENLAKLNLKVLRRGVWFRDLKQGERKLLSLTNRVVQRVRSFFLASWFLGYWVSCVKPWRAEYFVS
jgi:hypothetical protein